MSDSYLAGMRVALTGVLSPAPSRISPPPLPSDATFPYLTLHQAVGEEVESLQGTSGLTGTVMQCNCWSPTYDEAFALRSAIVAALPSKVGAVAGTGLVIDAISGYRYSELWDAARQLHQVILRVGVWWTTP